MSWNVWTQSVNSGKIMTLTAVGPSSSISLSAAKNEYLAFQIGIRNGSTIINGGTITVSNLTGPGGATIASTNVQVSYVSYVLLSNYDNKLWPDGLIPKDFWSFNLAAGMTLPLWVGITIPVGAIDGDYSGTITLTPNNGETTKTVTYSIHVYNFALPSEAKCRTCMGMSESYFAPVHGYTVNTLQAQDLHKTYYEFLLQRGVSTWSRYDSLPVDIMSDEAVAYMQDPRCTGFGIPFTFNVNDLTTICNRIKSVGAWDKAYFYEFDETVTSADVTNIYTNYTPIMKQAGGTGTKIIATMGPLTPTWTMQTLVKLLEEGCNIWVPNDVNWYKDYRYNLDLDRINRLVKQRGDELWCYLTRNYFNITSHLTHPRVTLWINYQVGATGFLYWNITEWFDGNGVAQDPWTIPCGAPNGYPQFAGGGYLIYPGTHFGYDGPASSIRLEMFRIGLEDWKYFWLIEQYGCKEDAEYFVNMVTQGWGIFDITKIESTKALMAAYIENRVNRNDPPTKDVCASGHGNFR